MNPGRDEDEKHTDAGAELLSNPLLEDEHGDAELYPGKDEDEKHTDADAELLPKPLLEDERENVDGEVDLNEDEDDGSEADADLLP